VLVFDETTVGRVHRCRLAPEASATGDAAEQLVGISALTIAPSRDSQITVEWDGGDVEQWRFSSPLLRDVEATRSLLARDCPLGLVLSVQSSLRIDVGSSSEQRDLEAVLWTVAARGAPSSVYQEVSAILQPEQAPTSLSGELAAKLDSSWSRAEIRLDLDGLRGEGGVVRTQLVGFVPYGDGERSEIKDLRSGVWRSDWGN